MAQATKLQISQSSPTQPSWSGTGAWNTLLTRTENNAQKYGFDPKNYLSRYPRLADEAKEVFVGPMPVRDFLDHFLPVSSGVMARMPSSKRGFSQIPEDPANEADIYNPLLEALNAGLERCPGHVFRLTDRRADNSAGRVGSTKPDIVCYAIRHLPLVESDADAIGKASKTDMGFAATFIEIKKKRSMDHYYDPEESEDRDSCTFVLGGSKNCLSSTYESRKQEHGQNVAYAVEVCARQHRRFCFSVSVSGRTARLIRWDRAGAIATEAFDYVEHYELLCEFYWRFGSVSDEARGYDLSVERVLEEEEALFRRSVRAHIKTQVADNQELREECMATHYKRGFVSAIHLYPGTGPSNAPPEPRRFLVSRPLAAPLSLAGSGTRTYWAVESKLPAEGGIGRVVLLKDSWRVDGYGADIEGNVLRDLHGAGVQNIPVAEDDGDVRLESTSGEATELDRTLTRDFLDAKYTWVCSRSNLRKRIVQRIHYRLLLDIAGFDLLHLSGTHELLQGSWHAFQALLDAHTLAHRLHRDVHPGNIVLYNAQDDAQSSPSLRRGYLIDWDHSSAITRSPDNPELYRPTYQWQFASERLLLQTSTPNAAHAVMDDVESMFYVVLYCALLRLKHNLACDRLVKMLQSMFDQDHEYSGDSYGGMGKQANRKARRFTKDVVWTSKRVSIWIDTMCNHLQPLPGTSVTEEVKWSADSVARFWAEFLDKNSRRFPPNDRHDNIRADAFRLQRHAPRSALGDPFQPTIPSRNAKRKASESVGSDVVPKRPRVGSSRLSVPSPLATKHSIATAPPLSTMSRSQATPYLAGSTATSGHGVRTSQSTFPSSPSATTSRAQGRATHVVRSSPPAGLASTSRAPQISQSHRHLVASVASHISRVETEIRSYARIDYNQNRANGTDAEFEKFWQHIDRTSDKYKSYLLRAEVVVSKHEDLRKDEAA